MYKNNEFISRCKRLLKMNARTTLQVGSLAFFLSAFHPQTSKSVVSDGWYAINAILRRTALPAKYSFQKDVDICWLCYKGMLQLNYTKRCRYMLTLPERHVIIKLYNQKLWVSLFYLPIKPADKIWQSRICMLL